MELTSQERIIHEKMWSSLPKRTQVEITVRQLERSIWSPEVRIHVETVSYPPLDETKQEHQDALSDSARAHALEMIAELTKVSLALSQGGDKAAKAAGDWLESQDKSEHPLRRSLYQFQTFMEMLAESGY